MAVMNQLSIQSHRVGHRAMAMSSGSWDGGMANSALKSSGTVAMWTRTARHAAIIPAKNDEMVIASTARLPGRTGINDGFTGS